MKDIQKPSSLIGDRSDGEIVEQTRHVWTELTGTTMTETEGKAAVKNMSTFIDILSRWDSKQQNNRRKRRSVEK